MTASPTCAVTSKLQAVGRCSCHHLQGAGAYCGGPTTGYKWLQVSRFDLGVILSVNCARKMKLNVDFRP